MPTQARRYPLWGVKLQRGNGDARPDVRRRRRMCRVLAAALRAVRVQRQRWVLRWVYDELSVPGSEHLHRWVLRTEGQRRALLAVLRVRLFSLCRCGVLQRSMHRAMQSLRRRQLAERQVASSPG